VSKFRRLPTVSLRSPLTQQALLSRIKEMVESSASPYSMQSLSPVKAELDGDAFSIWYSSDADGNWGYVLHGRVCGRDGECLVICTLREAGSVVGSVILTSVSAVLFGWLAVEGLASPLAAALMVGVALVPVALRVLNVMRSSVVDTITREVAAAIESRSLPP
jgi:hypothetical protein